MQLSANVLETMMLVCFGMSWPFSIAKSIRSRSTKGKSILFSCLVWVGYFFGIASKFMRGNINYVLVFYFIDILFVTTDMLLFLWNRQHEKKQHGVHNA